MQMYLLEIKRTLIYATETEILKEEYQAYCPRVLIFKLFQQSHFAITERKKKITFLELAHQNKSENFYC